MQQLQIDRKVPKKAYLVYILKDIDVEIQMILNPNSETEVRRKAKAVYRNENNPSIYLFTVDMPDMNFLRENNAMAFEMSYCPFPGIVTSYYSEMYSLPSDNSFIFMIGLKFLRNEMNMRFSDAPGEPVDNALEEFFIFNNFILMNYLYYYQSYFKLGKTAELSLLLPQAFTQIADLISTFKTRYSLLTNPKLVIDYLSKVDECILTYKNSYGDFNEIYLFLVSLYGIFSFDFFTTHEFISKNSTILLNYVIQNKIMTNNITRDVIPYLSAGFYVLINIAIKDGQGIWIELIKNKQLNFENEDVLFSRINDFIKRNGTSMKGNSKEIFLEIKNYILNTKIISQFDTKIVNGLIKNIAIISGNKENLLEMIFEFYEKSVNGTGTSSINFLDSEKIKILKDEIKRKKWEMDNEDNMAKYISKLKFYSKEEGRGHLNNHSIFKQLLYEISPTVKYLLTLLRICEYNTEEIDLSAFLTSFKQILELSLEDFTIFVSALKNIPSHIKLSLIDSSLHASLKQCLKKIILPFNTEVKSQLPIILLNEELFPFPANQSLEYIKEFMKVKNKPSFEDITYMCRWLIYPQKKMNTEKNFSDIWLNIKNQLLSSFVELSDLIHYFNILIESLSLEADLDFINWFCDEMWRTIHHKYSIDTFLGFVVTYNDDKYNKFVINSFLKCIKKLIDGFDTSDGKLFYSSINQFVCALFPVSATASASSNNKLSEIVIEHLLNFIDKNSNYENLISNFLYENPTKDSFWYRLIRCGSENIIKHNYMTKIINAIKNVFSDVTNGTASIYNFIYISKQNFIQREALISYFIEISGNRTEDSKAELINLTLENQLEILSSQLKVVNELEYFFKNYGNFIENSEDYYKYLQQLQQSYITTEFLNFNIRADLDNIKTDIEVINKWTNSFMFRNIFDLELHSHDKSFNLSNANNRVEITKFLEICKICESQIKKTLESILLKEDFTQLTLSVSKKYFKGLSDYLTESNTIEAMIVLGANQITTLRSILKTFCEISDFIKFSQSMIKLNSLYNFAVNNTHIYADFISLINKSDDSTFDKIYKSSVRLSEIRQNYSHVSYDIENILFELGEDKDLVHFLLFTPEDDIRNMVDAVDEHGDSFIRLQTIRDLIIIGSFVKSLNLKDFLGEKSAGVTSNPTEEDFVKRIHLAFKKSAFTGIDALLNSCMKQFLGIKHLHNELSNREEASKIKAIEISKMSIFDFNFNQEKKIYEVSIKYAKTNKKINYRDLCDLRDRVLLLLFNGSKENLVSGSASSNSISDYEKEKEIENSLASPDHQQESFISFIKIVEITERILFILNNIYHNGYPNRLTNIISMKDGNYEYFENYLSEITEINKKWNEDLKEAYVKYYPLTFFNGNQFWELELLFEAIQMQGQGQEQDQDQEIQSIKDTTTKINEFESFPGFYLLKYADPHVTIDNIYKCIQMHDLNLSPLMIEKEQPKHRILKLGNILSMIINPNRTKQLENIKKVNLNLKNNHIIYSFPSNLRIYTYLLSIHFSVESAIPNSNQIFYCRKDTTFHELISFLYRFIYCKIPRVFSLLRVENLPFELQNYLAEQINKLCRNKNLIAYLSIICCDSYSFLHNQFIENEGGIYLMREFDILDEMLISDQLQDLHAYVIRSDDTGAGKTHYIRSKTQSSGIYVDFPIVDGINISRINERLYKLNSIQTPKLLHLTICGIIDDFEMLDYLLFSIIIIGSVKHDVYVSFLPRLDQVYIEVANTFNDYLYNAISVLSILPNMEMIMAADNISNSLDIVKDIKDPLQLIVNYLYNYDRDYLNETDIVPEIQMNTKIFSKEDCLFYLNKYFIKGNKDITFRQIQIFLKVLNDQLIKFSNNYFFSVENLGYIQDDNLKDIRGRIMQCLLLMTEEFTTRSIKAARDSQNVNVFKLKRSYSREEINDEEKRMDEYNSLGNILSWTSSNHLIIMFHEDGMCVTPVYREAAKVNEAVRELSESQRQTLEDYQVFSHFELLEKLTNIVGRQFNLDALAKKQDYIITADNFLKMLLIIIRARCLVPIVIMGETGCGKTSLIKYLSSEIMQEGFEVINFHAGIKEHHIIEKMNEIIIRAEMLKVTDNKIWVFLDEINTCDCLGLITEIICQKTLLGERLPENIIFIAACNPYKVRKNTQTEVGLVKQRVTSRLVYRVHPLPDALIDYVWDYGSLSEREERLYISSILKGISGDIVKISIDAVCNSQIFIRKCEDKYSVSLRDVARFHTLHEWFYKTLLDKNDLEVELGLGVGVGVGLRTLKYIGKLMVSRKALILSVMLCYYNRINKNEDRMIYKGMIADLVGIKVSDMDEMINEEQRDILTRMELPPAIAINKALLENVFTLMVCVINKIPLFICGKPGCSKSLSVQLIVSNLRGQDSHDNFFKKLPRVLAIPYQGSESSTSEGIEKIFEKARSVIKHSNQSSQDVSNSILPLIVFDEIGLAEISKNNPLKILHSLLEPEKAEIAFVGISNWRLDASKMNRAVYLARPDPDLEDLENTSLSIFEYYIKEPKFDEKTIMRALARTYFEYKQEQSLIGHPDFHGTRDFYSLLKQVTKQFGLLNYNNYNEMKHKIIHTALSRNFGGLIGYTMGSNRDDSTSIHNIFRKNYDCDGRDIGSGYLADIPVMDLVKGNLSDRDSRFLLLFTNGESASYILDTYLKSDLKERVFMIGSEFEMDKDKDEHSFRLLSDIILYMESGKSIIMKNLDQIYGSLYDLFNQNFMIVGQKKNCRIALGSTNNPMCFVNNSFSCVVLVDLKFLQQMDPPFLNRFEKQILTFDSILTEKQKNEAKILSKWIKSLTYSGKNSINTNDLIMTYNDELAPSLILLYDNKIDTNEKLELCKRDILSVSSISLIIYSVLSELYQSQCDEVTKCHRIYFDEQYHDSLSQYIENSKNTIQNKNLVYTYSNILDEFVIPSSLVSSSILVLNIAEIKSEKEFDQRFKSFMNDISLEYLFIKVDVIKEKAHIPNIKFKVDKLLAEVGANSSTNKRVFMIIYLSRSVSASYSGSTQLESHFLSGWNQIMIDCLNGGQIHNLKHLLDLSTLEIVKKNLDQKSIAESIFNIYNKFSFNTYNNNDMSLVKLYITESIHKIEMDSEIFQIIFDKLTEYLENKDLPDWKIKICCDRGIMSRSVNIFQAIKLVIEQIIEEPLLRIIHYIETESALNSYFNTTKPKIFKKIWREEFEKKDLNQNYTYNVTQSLNVNCIFDLIFPFSKGDIYEISQALKDHIDKIYTLDNAAYLGAIIDEELTNNFVNEISVIKKITNTSVLFKILAKTEERSLETAYISDLITYFLITEMKKEYKWKNSLDIIVKKCVSYDVDNLEYIFLFLWKNRKILDAIFNIFNALNKEYNGDNSKMLEIDSIESILSDDKLYDCNSGSGSNHYFTQFPIRKECESRIFSNIFNTFAHILLSNSNKNIGSKNIHGDNININIDINHNISSYAVILNTFISSLINFSLEIKGGEVDALNILIVLNEFLKIMSSIFKNDKDTLSKCMKGIFNHISDYKQNTLDNINTTLKDFKFIPVMLDIIDNEYEILKIRQKNPENFIKQIFIENIHKIIISGKLTIFENVILAKCDFNTITIIIENILKDEDLCQHSSMIFYHLYSEITISESNFIDTLLNSPLKSVLDKHLSCLSMNTSICSFFSDFFRKFLYNVADELVVDYLKKNLENYFEFLNLAVSENSSKYERLLSYAGLKHYLDLYGRYLANNNLVKDTEVLEKVNKSLEKDGPTIELLRNYTLKSMAAFYGGTANTLINVNYEELKVNWVNNKVFENNDNALGIEPNLPMFEHLNKEYYLFFVSLLNEENEENLQKFKNLIADAANNPEMKFIIIQFFINKIWLNFSHPKYSLSYTYQYVQKLFETVKADIKGSLGEAVVNLIYNLVHNFPKISQFRISYSTETNRIGMFTLALQMLNMLLSFGSRLCLGQLFYKGDELGTTLNHWQNVFLPGGFVEYQDENLLVMMKHIDENYEIYGNQIGLYECECGFLYTIGDCTRPYYVSQCPNCTGRIGGTGHVLMQGHKNLINADNRNESGRKKWVIDYLRSKLKNNPGYVSKMADELSMHYSIRGLTSIGFRFLNFFNHSTIYLLTEIGALDEKSLEKIIYVKGLQLKPKDYLIKHILTDITKLTELIKSKEFYIFMHVIFNEFVEMNKEPFRFDSAIEREKFEIAFQTKIIQPKLDKLAGEISEYKMFFNNEKKLNYLSIINENFSEGDIRALPNFELYRIFRYTRLGYWDDLKTEFHKKKVPYQFLKLLIEKFEDLTHLSDCLYPITQFTNYMLNQCNFKFTRAEAKEKRIRDLIVGNSTAEALYINFAKAWSKIGFKCTQWQCKSLPQLESIDLDLPLSFILVDDRELGYGMYMAAAFQHLGSIQNQVLEAIVYLIKEDNNYQIWGNMDTFKYPLQKISPHEIIMYQTDKDFVNVLTDTFSKFYDIFNPHFGQGFIVEYNFEKIEGELAFKLLTNKKFLDYENLNKIQYKFELLSIQGRHSNLLTDIKSVIPQVSLTQDEYNDCNKYLDKLEHASTAYLHQIFSSLEIILCNLRYQNNVENMPLDTYIARLMTSNEKISQFLKDSSMSCLTRIKLSGILSFYHLVEEKLFKYIVEYISPEYNKNIDESVKIKIIEFVVHSEINLNKYPSAKMIVDCIQRFVIRCLVATVEPKFPIKEYLMRIDFWDVDTREEIIDNFYFEFPDDILIANTLNLYQILKDYLNEGVLDLEENKFDTVRHDFFKKQNKYI